MKRLGLVFATLLVSLSVFALDMSLNFQGAYYIPSFSGYQSSGFAAPVYQELVEDGYRTLGSTWGGAEAKLAFSVVQKIPFLVGEGPLFSGNNLRLKGTGELSPVSANIVGQVSLTPIALLVFDLGAGIGTGWTLGPFRGLGINNNGTIDLTPFGGAVWRAWGAATFQFDFAAIFPGDWNHIVLLSNAKVEYESNTGASATDAWLWEADSGENFNGFKLWTTSVLAYQMPLVLNMFGIMFETEEWLGSVREMSPMASVGGWGSDFCIMQIGPMFNFRFSEKDSLAVLVQFKRKIDWTDATTRAPDFRDRDYEDGYWYFNRVAFSYTHSF